MSKVVTITGHNPSARDIENMAKRTSKKLAQTEHSITGDQYRFADAIIECEQTLEKINKLCIRLDECQDSRLETIKNLACRQIEANKLMTEKGWMRDAKTRRIKYLEGLIHDVIFQMSHLFVGCENRNIDIPKGFEAIHRTLQFAVREK